MPDWNHDNCRSIRELIERFLSSLNDRDYHLLEDCLADDIVMSREDTYRGKEQAIGWYKKMFSGTGHGAAEFELLDASTGLFSEDQAQVILCTEIYQNRVEKELFIESVNIVREDGRWKISQLFGLSYEPESHREYFGKFLPYSN